MIYNNIAVIASPEVAGAPTKLKVAVAKKLKISESEINDIRIIKKSIDARSRVQIKVNLTVDVYTNDDVPQKETQQFEYKDVSSATPVIVVGSGPAGLFAALRLIELNLKPIVLERGKDILERKKDIAQLDRNKGLNPESNYCFGEGGAGTFSDGKLFSRSKKRGNFQRILQIFNLHGAADEILYEAHPHIGTDKLPEIIKNIRKRILEHGGEVHFCTKVTELILKGKQVKGVKTKNGDIYEADAVILATGHSARDVYEMLERQNVELEAKGFAMGVRVEHPQKLIDHIQYHVNGQRSEFLPAASYSLVAQVKERGVYSFCMCPGGFIVPASTYEGETVVNGMSPSRRNSPFANSGIVVEIRPEDILGMKEFGKYGVLAGLKYQQYYEQLSYQNGGGFAIAPAQRLLDFVRGKVSTSLPKTSYVPGLVSSAIHEWQPAFIRERLQGGFQEFDKKMRGFLTNEAIIVGVESRTSSPVRVPRDKDTLEHITIKGLYPCGEGAGYAGGITSSAVDGEKCAEKIAEWLK
ncbi:MAG: FAD-dependent oxidoreductase [Paludibacteraceae bacterium]|nr:FAD-dependent oxidoreductase [Paludibacteraceae bacterium]